jgi:hypothetical protein
MTVKPVLKGIVDAMSPSRTASLFSTSCCRIPARFVEYCQTLDALFRPAEMSARPSCPDLAHAGSSDGSNLNRSMIQPEQLLEAEWAEWYRLTPAQRWLESEKLWRSYLAMGGSFDPEPDTQSPFFDTRTPCSRALDGGPGVRVLWRGGV